MRSFCLHISSGLLSTRACTSSGRRNCYPYSGGSKWVPLRFQRTKTWTSDEFELHFANKGGYPEIVLQMTVCPDLSELSRQKCNSRWNKGCCFFASPLACICFQLSMHMLPVEHVHPFHWSCAHFQLSLSICTQVYRWACMLHGKRRGTTMMHHRKK